jgi:hypothetical protein
MYHAWERWKICEKFWSENLKVKDHKEDLDIDGRIILEWILGNSVGHEPVASGSGERPVPGSWLGSVKGGEFLEWLSDLASQGLCSM